MVIKKDMLFTPNGKNRRLHIWLPDNYELSTDRYPVMYFFDGHNLFYDRDATYGKSWGLSDYLRAADRRMIIVGIECGHEPGERISEYCPYDLHGGFFGQVHGTGDATLRWMTETLKPYVDNCYRTLPDRENTAICGSSMGGLMSIFAAIRYSGYFSKAACLSSAIIDRLPEDARNATMQPMRVYLSWGTQEAGGTHDDPDEDMRTELAGLNFNIEESLRSHGAETYIYCQRGGRHCEADWEKQLPILMDFLWQRV